MYKIVTMVLISAFSVHADENCTILSGVQALERAQHQVDSLSNSFSTLRENIEVSCSAELGSNILAAIKTELKSSSQSLSMSFYHDLDKIIYCDSKGEIKKDMKQKILKQLEVLKKLKKTPFVWADALGVKIWDKESPKIRQNLPFKLSQLNSSVIVFVPSEENNQTTYNLEADLKLPIFSSWDRRKNLIKYENAERENEDRILKQLEMNFTRNYNHIEVSKISSSNEPLCYYYVKTEKIECPQDYSSSITHEISHLLESRFPHFFKKLLKAEGGQNDRLKKAQEIVPQFGISKCTRDAFEDYCTEGPISEEETIKIAKATKIFQDNGTGANRHQARKMTANDNFCETPVVKQYNHNYCVDKKETMYAFVRNGEEYLQVLIDKAFNDKEQFENSASAEEKALIALLKEYLY